MVQRRRKQLQTRIRPSPGLPSHCEGLITRLLLSERDVHRLAPAVTAWLERGVPAEAVRRALTTGLPSAPIQHPAAFLASAQSDGPYGPLMPWHGSPRAVSRR